MDRSGGGVGGLAIGRGLRAALAVLATLTACWVMPSLARAADTVTRGPSLSNVSSAGGCPTATTTGADEPYFDCSYVNTIEPAGVVAQAPADGTITSWSVAFWNGTADLVIVKPTSSGDEIVAKSAPETEPCIPENLGGGTVICNPQPGVFTYKTNLPIKAGDYIGIEGISAMGCGAVYFNGGSCFMVGFAGGTSQYWNQTPALNAPTTFSNDGGGGQSGGIALDAVEDVTAKTVSVSLSPATITADGRATTIATATVTDNGSPVADDSVSITTSDSGEQVGPVTGNGDGTYSATITSSETVGTPTVTATDVSDASQPSGTVTLTQSAPTIGVSVKPGVIAADGKATAIATVKLTGVQGEAVPGQSVTIATTGPAGGGPVTDNGDGTYTSVITSTDTPGDVTVTGTDVSVAPSVSAQAQLTTAPKVVSVSLAPAKITADGLATTVATAAVSEDGNPVAGDSVAISSSDGGEKVGAVVDHGDGTYTATITASEAVGTPTVMATDASDALMPSGTANLTQAPPTIRVSVKPGSITADGKSTATATVKLTGVHGEPVPGQAVSITTAGPAFAGLVRDGRGGTYTARITASHAAGNVTVKGSDTLVDPSVSGHAKLKLKAKKIPAGNCRVPKLAGDTLAAAKRALPKAKCAVGKVTVKKSGKVAKGRVISSSPKAGAHRKSGARVNLLVSRGKH